jgi:hypothetical protein
LARQYFEYGPLAQGAFKALIWLVVLITFTAPWLLMIYIPFLIFLGLGLRPFLISTGLYRYFQVFLIKNDDLKNERLKKANNERNPDQASKRAAHIKAMRKKMTPKE